MGVTRLWVESSGDGSTLADQLDLNRDRAEGRTDGPIRRRLRFLNFTTEGDTDAVHAE